jgi:hypothetical protein
MIPDFNRHGRKNPIWRKNVEQPLKFVPGKDLAHSNPIARKFEEWPFVPI